MQNSQSELGQHDPWSLYLPYDNKYELQGCCFKTRPHWRDMKDRTIITNIQDHELPDNTIRTCKYTLWTFLPLNLMEQFSKMANIYFLIVGYLETIDLVSITDGQPVIWFPLFVVIAISAFKDFLEDHKRQISDQDENNRIALVLTSYGLVEKKWQQILVGDIIRIEQGEYFPADVIVIKTSQKGTCFIETKNLDGETNLKIKKQHKGLQFTRGLNDHLLQKEHILVHYDKPNPYLYKFNGTITMPPDHYSDGDQSRDSIINYDALHRKVYQLDEVNFILRGCSLRNTHWIYGLVVYTGFDTKIMLNSTKARPKSSTLESQMNFFIILVFFIQLVICLFSAQYSVFWQLDNFMDIPYLELDENDLQTNIVFRTMERWGTWLLIYTNFVPISLLVTLEMVKYLQGMMIENDKQCNSQNHRTEVQTSNLNEELGNVKYMFTDKTGTITKNLMEFKMISIYGKSYGNVSNRSQILTNEDLIQMPQVTNVDFKDKQLFNDLDQNDEHSTRIIEYFMHLTLCHTILVEYEQGKIKYNASSPDELALLMGAKFCGFEYIGLDDGMMIVKYKDQLIKYKLLQVLEFSSSRKRMSVIVQDQNDQIMLLCKGADSMIINLLDKQNRQNQELLSITEQHLEQYAEKGLRTLLLAYKDLSKQQYDEWISNYLQAGLQTINRDEQLLNLQDQIEKNLVLIGGTGIEDKLQDDVGNTMQKILNAGIKIWVLTGDKLETAINISYACNLLNDSQQKIVIQADDQFEAQFKINQGLDLLKSQFQNNSTALIISGDSLIHLDEKYQIKLIDLAKQCHTVLACRVSPKQKQELVQLVKDNIYNIVTMAVGDGANDVNMITAANIGIGIKGVEGNQAARAADYSIGEFKILQQLLLYHGRECYRRNQVLVGYNFYKNLLIVLPHFWFSFYNGFSPLNLYDPWLYQFYNMFYTSVPIMVYAILDQQYSSKFLLQNPQLYQTNNKVTLLTFFFWFCSGGIQSAIVIYAVFPSMVQTSIDKEGRILFLSSVGMAVFCYAIIIVNLKVFVFSYMNSIGSVLFIFGSIFMYLLTYMILSQFTDKLDVSHTFIHLFSNIQFYFILSGILVLTILFDLALQRWSIFSEQQLFEIQKIRDIQEPVSSQKSRFGSTPPSSLMPPDKFENLFQEDDVYDDTSALLPVRPVRNRKYTGYAFAQQEKKLDEALKNAEN
ncbi:unnamed protein product [Paramecium pentaurelia]|uniref:Phospholipid-transporting ATPase n=1 Tax=Paramecium pentaurelia TaxID=43138 RepID=A0A8S1SPF4_9CILI|nr:unnamed protein product [Paramecium pentaurelia]